VEHRQFAARGHSTQLSAEIDRFEPRLVALAGFMRVLTPKFVNHYAGRLLNIHPSLLPAFPGLDTHARARSRGQAAWLYGAFRHPELDSGRSCSGRGAGPAARTTPRLSPPVCSSEEHVIYPRAAQWFLDDRLVVRTARSALKENMRNWFFLLLSASAFAHASRRRASRSPMR
jgi:phosphoribosylglycinamide formyltransferase-1